MSARRVVLALALLVACGREKERPFPVVESEGQESSIVSLTMALRAGGAMARVADVAHASGKPDGWPLERLVRAAAAYDRRARAIRLEAGAAVATLPAGTLLRFTRGRWGVLARAGAAEVAVAEPGLGVRTMPPAELWRTFTGTAVLIERWRPGRPRVRPELDAGDPVVVAFRYHGVEVPAVERSDDLVALAARHGLLAQERRLGSLEDLDARLVPRGSLLRAGPELIVAYSGPAGDRLEVVHGERGKVRVKAVELEGLPVVLLEPMPVASSAPGPGPHGARRVAPIVAPDDPGGGGASACLAMILGYHDRPVDVDSLRPSVEGEAGATALTIIRAAEARGLVARGVEVTDGDLELIPLPAILHWNYRNFVVLERVDGERVELVDPRVGFRRMSRDQLWRSFSGVALLFEEVR